MLRIQNSSLSISFDETNICRGWHLFFSFCAGATGSNFKPPHEADLLATANGRNSNSFQVFLISKSKDIFHSFLQQLLGIGSVPRRTVYMDDIFGREILAQTNGSWKRTTADNVRDICWGVPVF